MIFSDSKYKLGKSNKLIFSHASGDTPVFITLYQLFPFDIGFASYDISAAAYSGFIYTLRRDSDDQEKSFYLDTSVSPPQITMSSLNEDGTSLSDWVGANSAFLVRGWDQTGGSAHADQIADAAQPTIVDSGMLVTKDGISAIRFGDGGANIWLEISYSDSQPFASFSVTSHNNTGTFQMIAGIDGQINPRISAVNPTLFASSRIGVGGVQILSPTATSADTRVLIYVLGNGLSGAISINTDAENTGNLGSDGIASSIFIGNRDGIINQMFGTMQLFTYYSSDQSANKSDIISKIQSDLSL